MILRSQRIPSAARASRRGRSWPALAAAAGLHALAAAASAQPGVYTAPAGDAAVHRTDLGGTTPLSPTAVLPDLIGVTLQAWQPASVDDPYSGAPADPHQAHILRMDLTFQGLVNPPGPLGLGGQPYQPFIYGPSPVYGFIELDVDDDPDTGGELGGAAQFRYLANVGRLGRLPGAPLTTRAATSAADLDFDFNSTPQFERSGEDFSLVLCGCSAISIVSPGAPLPPGHGFGAGDTWIIRGRFFQRAAGYRNASIMFGGSGFGLYDPMVNLRFSHDIPTDRTTITLVFALDPRGASILTGEPQQPLDNFIDIGGSHASVLEALHDIADGARGYHGGPLSGPTAVLTERWRYKDPDDYLDPTRWRVTALVGTAYADAIPGATYVWTDAGFDAPLGDCTGDGRADGADRQAILDWIAAHDGGPDDLDGQVNGCVELADFAFNFSPYDINADGRVDQADAALIPLPCPADWDHDGVVTPSDVSLYVQCWFLDLSAQTTAADFDHNGIVEPADICAFVTSWLSCLH